MLLQVVSVFWDLGLRPSEVLELQRLSLDGLSGEQPRWRTT